MAEIDRFPIEVELVVAITQIEIGTKTIVAGTMMGDLGTKVIAIEEKDVITIITQIHNIVEGDHTDIKLYILVLKLICF